MNNNLTFEEKRIIDNEINNLSKEVKTSQYKINESDKLLKHFEDKKSEEIESSKISNKFDISSIIC